MNRTMMRAKIHRAVVTGADIHYVGSISIDPALMEAAGILEFEQVHVVDVDNGARLVTYAIVGQPGEICLNGAAAHLVDIGDRIIIITYTQVDDREIADYRPTIVHVDTLNRQVPEEIAKAAAASRRYVTVEG
ncbi:MAG: aspartate 1-decarboxylase [Acidimicrobiia bacterium]